MATRPTTTITMSASGSTITGDLISTDQENGTLVDNWRIPAMNESLARARARANSIVKGRSSPSVVNVEKIGDGDLPRQDVYRIKVESGR